jgi:class 3 adenylate cyclase
VDPDAISAVERFPGSNPNPVMRVLDDGRLGYANAASEPLLAVLSVSVGDRLSGSWLRRLRDSAASGTPIELAVGTRTFELVAVVLPELGFTNLYGTDVTAARLVDKFPDLNPNPVLRITEDGQLRYANAASEELRRGLGAVVGQKLPTSVSERVFEVLDGGETDSVEFRVDHQTYRLKPVRIPEIGLINVYGTDITAQKAIVKFPDQNPNPVFRLTWDGTLVYANPASSGLIEGLGAAVGQPFPAETAGPLMTMAGEATRGTFEVVSNERRYALLPVDVPEFGFINVYGTDVTAARQLESLYRENERLLLNILPAPIADRLRAGEPLIADRFDEVSLLFADIVGFTQLSSGMTADELVAVLNELFTVFDRLVAGWGLEKVKTIGDAYMVVGGMTDQAEEHLERMGRLALALATELDTLDAATRYGIRFRIGIHCGPVVAGVIGTKKFIYDIWGDTVNVASRMEAMGAPGRIHVSAAVEQRLRGRFIFEPRGVTEIKGKGPMATFFLVAEAGPSRPEIASDSSAAAPP